MDCSGGRGGRLRQRQSEARANNQYLGIGVACFVEHTSTGSADYRKRGVAGMLAFDAATVRMDASGNVDIAVSAQSAGQDHARVFAKLAAQELGITEAVIRVVEGDTDRTPFGAARNFRGLRGRRSLRERNPAVARKLDGGFRGRDGRQHQSLISPKLLERSA